MFTIHVHVHLCMCTSSCPPGDGGDLSQSITELKSIVLAHSKQMVDFSHEVRGQLATINATVSSLQGKLESLAGEVVRNRQRINVVNRRMETVEAEQFQIVHTADNISTGVDCIKQSISELNSRVESVELEQVKCQNTSLQLANATDQLSTGLNQLRTELTANQQMISERVDGVSSQQVRIQNETMVQLQIVHTTLDTQLVNATDKLCAKLNQLKKELTTNQPSSDLECNRTQMENVSAQEQNSTEAPQDTQDTPVYQHTCAGPGWRRVAFLNMTDPSQDCPSGWNLTTHSVRTCGRLASSGRYTCDPVTFPVSGEEYSRVCGRIRAYQYGVGWAFTGAKSRSEPQSLDGSYVDGISITHGLPRQHIWTFAAGIAQEHCCGHVLYHYCYCDVQTRPYSYPALPPSFVGNDYFCEAGMSGQFVRYDRLISENPLWDGQNCGQNSTCCSMNSPPYFMKDLPAPTTDDIEVRLCSIWPTRGSNYPIDLLEIYVK